MPTSANEKNLNLTIRKTISYCSVDNTLSFPQLSDQEISLNSSMLFFGKVEEPK